MGGFVMTNCLLSVQCSRVAGIAMIVLAFCFSQTASAQAQAAVSQSDCGCWIDAKTGKSVPTVPLSGANLGGVTTEGAGTAQLEGFDPKANRAYNPKTGQNFARVPCPPPARPVTANPPPEPPKTASLVTPGWSGMYLGGELAKNWGRVRSTETLDATGAQTNQFTDSGDPIGGGINVGFNFKPWNSNIVIGPFVSVDKLNQTINHNFAGGSFLGTKTNLITTVGAKVGVLTTPSLLLYGTGSVSWLKEDLNINFGGPVTSNSTTVRGSSLGIGGEYQPSALQNVGVPVSLFLQYNHTWWQDAKLNTPAASPTFNYAFKRHDDTLRFGVNFYFR